VRQKVDLWSFILAMALIYGFSVCMLLSAIGLSNWRVDVLVIWQLGCWALAVASAMDGWMVRSREAKTDAQSQA